MNLLSRLSRVDGQCFKTCALSYPEFKAAWWSGCPIGCDGCVTTDHIRYDTDAVTSLPDIQRLIPRCEADALRVSNLPARGAALSACRHLPAEGLRICTWSTRGLQGSAASSPRPREKKLKYLKRIAEKSDGLCLQETHGGIEHFLNVEIALERAVWEIFGTFITPGNVNPGGPVIMIHRDILGPGPMD